MNSQSSINNFLENLIIKNWQKCIDEFSDTEAHPDWTMLVDRCNEIALYPYEQPKSMVNFIHELLNWIDCLDSRFENPPTYQQGERQGQPADELAVNTMKWYFTEVLSPYAIDALRKLRP
mgnify:CR=1 FL=1|jgi:hypothetical protein